jgi:hypothetical protein
MEYITSSGCIAGAGLHACARAVRLRQVGVAPEEAGGGVARKAVVTVAAGGVGGGVEDIPALAARSPARAADEALRGAALCVLTARPRSLATPPVGTSGARLEDSK